MAGVLAALAVLALIGALSAQLHRSGKATADRLAATETRLAGTLGALFDLIRATEQRLSEAHSLDLAQVRAALDDLAGSVDDAAEAHGAALKTAVSGQRVAHKAILAAIETRPLPPERPELDADDVAMLREVGPQGHLKNPLCVWCGGWHVPPLPAAGCPRIKSADISKEQAVTHVEYHQTWDQSRTVFPWDLPPLVEEQAGG